MCKRTKKIREHWYSLGQRRCHCCGVQLNWAGDYKNSATVEHIVPKAKGGTLARKNTLVVCRSCNSKRGVECFKSFVTGRRLPKKEWLYKKAVEAKEYHDDRHSRRRS